MYITVNISSRTLIETDPVMRHKFQVMEVSSATEMPLSLDLLVINDRIVLNLFYHLTETTRKLVTNGQNSKLQMPECSRCRFAKVFTKLIMLFFSKKKKS